MPTPPTATTDAWVVRVLGAKLPALQTAGGPDLAPNGLAANGPARAGGPGDPPPIPPKPNRKPPPIPGKPGKAPDAPPLDKPSEYAAKLKAVEDRVATIKALPNSKVAGSDLKQVQTTCIDPAKARATASPPDYDGGIAALLPATKLLDTADLHARRYNAGLTVAQQGLNDLKAGVKSWMDVTGWTALNPSQPDINPVIDSVQLNAINAAKAIADNAENDPAAYTKAMPMLENAATLLAPAQTRFNAMKPFLNEWVKQKTDAQAAETAAAGPVATALVASRVEFIGGAETDGKAGKYEDGLAKLNAAVAPRASLVDVGTKRNQAVAALGTLTLPSIAADRDRLKVRCLDGGDAKITAKDYAGAAKLLAEAITTAPQILAYGNALLQAKTALAGPPPSPDSARLNTTLVVPAATAAAANDYAGGTALLKQVADQVAQAKAPGSNPATQFAAAAKKLEDHIAAIDAAAAPEKASITTNFLAKARTGFRADAPDPAYDLLAKGELACVQAEKTAAAAGQYTAALAAANTKLAGLADPFQAADKAAIQNTMLVPAATDATARKFTDAIAKLAPVADACATSASMLAQNVLYLAARQPVADGHRNSVLLLQAAIANGLPARPDVTASLTNIKTNFLDKADTAVTSRGTGAPALAAVKSALALMTQIAPDAEHMWFETSFYRDAAAKRAPATNALAALKLHPNAAAVPTEIAALDRQMADAAGLLAANQALQAGRVYLDVVAECTECTRIADEAKAYAADLAAANTRIATCKGKLDGPPAAPAGIATLFAKMQQETVVTAAALAGTRDFDAAQALLKTVEPRCTAIEKQITDAGAYATELAAAKLERAKLSAPAQPEAGAKAVADEAGRIDTQYFTAATAAADKLDFAGARALLAKVAGAVSAAMPIAVGAVQAGASRQDANAALDGADLAPAIAALEKLLRPLLTHSQREAIKDLVAPIAATLAAAKSATPPGDIRARLKTAADQCAAARPVLDKFSTYAAKADTLEKSVTALGAAPLVAAEVAAINKDDLGAAKKLAAAPGRDFAGAMKLLETGLQRAATADALLKRDVAFQQKVVAAQAELDTLNALKPVPIPVIGPLAQEIQTKQINAAKTMAALPARDFDGAEKLLADVPTLVKTLAMRKKMSAGTAPTAAEMEEIIKGPGGTKALDKMISELPDNTPNAVMKAAFELRFKKSYTEVQDPTDAGAEGAGGAKSLKKVYELMALVPDSHTRDNPSMKSIQRFGGDATLPQNIAKGSYYQGADKSVVLSCGRATDTAPQPLQRTPLALPNVEPDCEMVPDDVVPPPKYFDWTTLHEVGHAIDDKKHFMQGKAGDSSFGGWQVHGSNVLPVAQAIVAATGLNATAQPYIVGYLLGTKPALPPTPPGDATWDGKLESARAWCDDIRVDKQLWESGGDSSKRAAGGRVFHEAYGGVWVSYELAARSKGITGYQFRAPGEWLSELYAAFHCKKLKPSHPAAVWLATL